MSAPSRHRGPRVGRRPGRLHLGSLGWLLVAALTLGSAHATSYLRLTPDAMLTKADLVFVGTVSDLQVAVLGDAPWTRVTFRVDTPLEGVPAPAATTSPPGATSGGSSAAPSVTLEFLGGSVPGGPALTVGGMPSFTVGETVLVFAYDQRYASPIVGFRQGLWRVGAAGLRDEDGELLTVAAGGGLERGGTGSSLDAVVAAIRTRLAAPSGTP